MMNQNSDLPTLTLEQLARIVYAAQYESRRNAKRRLRDCLPGRRAATAADLDAILNDARRHPYQTRIRELVEEERQLVQERRQKSAAGKSAWEAEQARLAVEAEAVLEARIAKAEAERDWLWLARYVLANPPNFEGAGDNLPGGLTRRDVPAEFLEEAQNYDPLIAEDVLIDRARALAEGTDQAVTLVVESGKLFEVFEAAYGYCVADQWIGEQDHRQKCLLAAEELAETFSPLLADCGELDERQETPNWNDEDEVTDWNRLHESRARFGELRGMIELVRIADNYEPARRRVEELLASV